MSSGLYCKGRRRTLRWSRCRGSYACTHKCRKSRVYTWRTRVQANVMRTNATDKLCGSGSYCYGYYLPLIRMGGQTGCKGYRSSRRRIGVCVRACVCVCAGMRRCLQRERDGRGSRGLRAAPSWTGYCRERDRTRLQTPLSLSVPRPDPRDFQDTRHTTHKPHTLCGVNQLDPSSLRARYRYNARGATKLSYDDDGT